MNLTSRPLLSPPRPWWRGADPTILRFERARDFARLFRADLPGLSVRRGDEAGLLGEAWPVYLSPHYDDVCFSLGAIAGRLKRGVLLDLFTKGQYRLATRDEEDRLFAERHGLRRIDLRLDEPPLRGRHPFDAGGVAEDRAALGGPLLDRLMLLRPGMTGEAMVLFCPAAIGGHVNHIATMQTVVEALPLLERRFRVLFYEDLHYASSGRKRREGLLRLMGALKGRRPVRHVFPLGADAGAKLEAVRLYRSQFGSLPEDLRGFTPRTLLPMSLHEAVWEFLPR